MTRGLRLSEAQFLGKKQGKIKNVRRKEINGITFDSTREARRYQDLDLMQRAGQITELRRQIAYPIFINDKKICDWFADFVYVKDGIRVIEDSKGWATDVYKLKKKMVEAMYSIKILET